MPYTKSAPKITRVSRPGDHTEDMIEHNSFGTIEVARVRCGGNGQELFESELNHHTFLSIKISKAKAYRNLHRTWIHSSLREDIIAEFMVSEAQWASLVSSVGIANATPITFSQYRDGDLFFCDGIEKSESLKDTHVREVKEALADHSARAKELCRKIETLMNAGKAGKGQLSELLSEAQRFMHLASNMGFAQESMEEAMEKTVAAGKAEVEAFAMGTVHKLGLQKIAELQAPTVIEDRPPLIEHNDNADSDGS